MCTSAAISLSPSCPGSVTGTEARNPRSSRTRTICAAVIIQRVAAISDARFHVESGMYPLPTS